MKKLTALFTVLLFATTTFSQDTTFTYLDKSFEKTDKANAEYTRKKFKTADGWGIQEFNKAGVMLFRGNYLDDSCKIGQGESSWYYVNGKLNWKAIYKNGKEEGKTSYYFDDGKVKMEGEKKSGNYDGDWVAYYPSGKISAKVHFNNGRQTRGEFYNEDGTINDKMDVFERESIFPGGDAGVAQYLSSNLRYPNKAIKNNIQGTVVVRFIVDKDGSVTDVQIVKSVDELLDNEAMRVIKKMPKWQPAVQGGKFVKSYKQQPISFKF